MGWPGVVAAVLVGMFMIGGAVAYLVYVLRRIRQRREAFQAELEQAAALERGPFDQDTIGPDDAMWRIFYTAMEKGGVAGTVVQTPDGMWQPVTVESEDGTVLFRDPSLLLPGEDE